MYKGKRIIGIIPARGGSKGLPAKNIRPLCGKPLIAWTIEQAKASQYLDEVMVTTDSTEIAEIAKQFGASVPFLRPAEIAGDTASIVDVGVHVLKHYSEKSQEFDYLFLLQPTSPLRDMDCIDRMIQGLIDREDQADAMISMGPGKEHPAIAKRVEGGLVQPYFEDHSSAARRQELPPALYPYGGCYLQRVASFLESQSFYPERILPYEVESQYCFDIDELPDFLATEAIMQWQLDQGANSSS